MYFETRSILAWIVRCEFYVESHNILRAVKIDFQYDGGQGVRTFLFYLSKNLYFGILLKSCFPMSKIQLLIP